MAASAWFKTPKGTGGEWPRLSAKREWKAAICPGELPKRASITDDPTRPGGTETSQ